MTPDQYQYLPYQQMPYHSNDQDGTIPAAHPGAVPHPPREPRPAVVPGPARLVTTVALILGFAGAAFGAVAYYKLQSYEKTATVQLVQARNLADQAKTAARTVSGNTSQVGSQVSDMAPTVSGISRFNLVCKIPLTDSAGNAVTYWFPCSNIKPGSVSPGTRS